MSSRVSSILDVRASDLPRRLLVRSLFDPIRDFMQRPGKGFRRRLVIAGWRIAGGGGPVPPPLARFVEQLHAGSLIVDDIEDGALERRGARALHREYGVPTALNAGNFLYFWPLAGLGRVRLPPARELGIHRAYARTMVRCHAGQALDLSVRVWDLPRSDVGRVVSVATRLKTGSLTDLAMSIGATAAGADPRSVRALGRAGGDLGVALQMLDDLSSVTNARRAHKAAEDLTYGRLTWAWAWAAEACSAGAYARLCKRGRAVGAGRLRPSEAAADLTRVLGDQPRHRVREELDAALARVRGRFGSSRALRDLENDVRKLERSFFDHG